VLAGDVLRAPAVVQRLGLEWVWRAMQDRGRVSRLVSLPRFVWLLVNEKVRQVS
jgi:N-acetylglucosaminyldiphosphoundecaprenol N-acetyl-beta-D-mannosaminyltransferase